MDMRRTLSNNQLPVLENLINLLQLGPYFKGDAEIIGQDPLLKSPHFLGDAIAHVLSIQAIAAAAIWKFRTGADNHISIKMQDAIHHLHAGSYIKQNGYDMALRADLVPTYSIFKCRDDRHVFISSGPPYPKLQDGYLNFFDCGNNRISVAREILKWDSLDLQETLNQAGLPCSICFTQHEWREHPQGKALSLVPVVEIEKIGEGAPQAFSERCHSPLEGIKVLDFTHVLAGPRSTMALAEFGADVLHISSPFHLDLLRQNLGTNNGKKNAFLELNDPEDREKMYRLIGEADIMANSYRPSVLEKYGMTPEEAMKHNKKGLIFLSVNAYGHSGPWVNRPGFDHQGQAASGFTVEEGSLEQPMVTPVFYLNDPMTGFFAAAGMMAALLRRATEGGHYRVKVSLTRSAMWVQDLGRIEKQLYVNAPETDIYPAKIEDFQGPYGCLSMLAPAVKFSQMPRTELLPLRPFGANLLGW